MRVTIKIKRFNPEKDSEPHWREYQVEAEPTDARARTASAGRTPWINRRDGLACKLLLKNLGSTITVEALRGLPLLKDLLVDMEGFFAKYRAVKPFLMADSPEPEKERLQSPEEREVFDDTTKCILCAACNTSCPSFWSNEDYVGPAAIVQAHRFIFDSRDEGHEERLAILNERDGVWRCRTIFNCVEACPRDINITRAIGEVKRTLAFRRL